MRSLGTTFLTALTSLLVLLPAAPAAGAGLPEAWDKGYTFTAWWNDHYAGPTAEDSLGQMVASNPNSVAFIATWYTDDLRDSTITARSDHTPTDASLAAIVAKAEAKGLRTFLRPLVDSYSGGWRGDYEPDDPAAWFRSYRRFIFHYARLARRLDVDVLAVGTEPKSMTAREYAPKWRSIIAGVRARFPGKLTYGGVRGDQVDWWDALDYYGINWYMALASASKPGDNTLPPGEARLDEDDIVARWSSFTDEYGITYNHLEWLQQQFERWRKPILFNELGYPSKRESLLTPLSWFTPTDTVDLAVQVRAYRAAFRALADKPWVAGVYLWQWSWNDAAVDPATDTDHSPQNKPAERSIAAWFAGRHAGSPAGRARTTLALDVQIGKRRKGATMVRVRGRVRGASRGAVVLRFACAGSRRVRTSRVRADGRFTVTVRLPTCRGLQVAARFSGTSDAAPSRARWAWPRPS